MNIEKVKKAQGKKTNGKKVAEVIYLSIGGVFLTWGVVCLVLALLIQHIGTETTSMKLSPLYFLIEFQANFKTWWDSWFFWKTTSFLSMGIWFTIIFGAYELLILSIYAYKSDVNEKKIRAKKLRENNVKKFLEEQKLNEEKINEAQPKEQVEQTAI